MDVSSFSDLPRRWTTAWFFAAFLAVVLPVSASIAAERMLPEGWFAELARERIGPAALSGPVEEQWRIVSSGLARDDVVGLHKGRVLIRRQVFASPGGNAKQPERPSVLNLPNLYRGAATELQCRDVRDGSVLWTLRGDSAADERVNGGVLFDEFVLVDVTIGQATSSAAPSPSGQSGSQRMMQSLKKRIWLADAATGKVLKRFGVRELPLEHPVSPAPPLRPAPAAPRSIEEAQDRLKLAVAGFERQTRQQLDELRKTYYASGGPSLDVPPDPLRWTDEDAERIEKTLTEIHVPRYGCSEWGLVGEQDHLGWLDLQAILRRAGLGDAYMNEVSMLNKMLFPMGPGKAAWLPPLVVMFTTDSAVTAYEIATGKPVWIYEWPVHDLSPAAGTMAALTDGILLITASHIPRPPIPARGPDGRSMGLRPNPWASLVKLDKNGRMIFKQELTVLAGSVVHMSGNHLITDNVCFGPASGASSKPAVPSAEESAKRAQRITELHARFALGDSLDRLFICADLADLQDHTIVDKVLAALAADPSRDKQEKDRYMWSLALLKDPKAIPRLVEMLDDSDGWIRQQAWKHLESLTDGDPARSSEYREWLARKTSSLHAAYEQAKSAFERTEICDQLGRMGDKTITEKVLADLEKAKPGERDFYVRMLWRLGDRRGIPRLITLIEECAPFERHEVDVALQALTGRRGPFVSDWRNWWEEHKHLYETK